jgi:hypothetical protein
MGAHTGTVACRQLPNWRALPATLPTQPTEGQLSYLGLAAVPLGFVNYSPQPDPDKSPYSLKNRRNFSVGFVKLFFGAAFVPTHEVIHPIPSCPARVQRPFLSPTMSMACTGVRGQSSSPPAILHMLTTVYHETTCGGYVPKAVSRRPADRLHLPMGGRKVAIGLRLLEFIGGSQGGKRTCVPISRNPVRGNEGAPKSIMTPSGLHRVHSSSLRNAGRCKPGV